MIILDREKLELFWDSIAKGFDKSLVEIIITLALLLCVIIIPTVIFLIIQKKKKKLEQNEALDLFNSMLKKRGITDSEIKVLNRMKKLFKRDVIYLPQLITSAHTFNHYATILAKNGVVSDMEVASLRLKLGLNRQHIFSAIHSTVDLIPGAQVLVRLSSGGIYKGLINNVTEDCLEIRLKAMINKKQPVILEIKKVTGCYQVHTRIISCNEHIIQLEHSERVEQIQNRAFFRKAVDIKAYIKMPGYYGHTYPTRTMDLGGGGARIINPRLNLEIGNKFLFIVPLQQEQLFLNAEVKQIANDKSSFGIAFNSIRESTRDRIMKFVLNN